VQCFNLNAYLNTSWKGKNRASNHICIQACE